MLNLVKNYTTRKAELLKLEVTEKSSLATGNMVFIALLSFFFLFFFFIVNIGIGFLISDYLGNYAYGFLILAGFYFILVILVLLLKKTIKNSVANKIIRSINK